MNSRAIFPTIMFVLAGLSFLFGGWQYFQARAVAASSQQRMAFIMTTIEKSSLARVPKYQLYASIMKNLPAAPGLFSVDFSGSFASTGVTDGCTSEGQRSICSALKAQHTDITTMTAICGVCNPK